MSKGLIKRVSLVFVGLLLVTLTGLVSCAEKEAHTRDITIGILSDFTGAASSGCTMLANGMEDYFRMTNEEDPIPGARLKIITYDMRLDYARNPGGYQWLVGQGANIIQVTRNTDFEMLVDRFERDKIPCFGSMGSLALRNHDWVYMFPPITQWYSELIMDWIWSNWHETRLPLVGHVGISGYAASTYLQEGLEALHTAHPDKFDLVPGLLVPSGTAAWAVEVSKVKSCDFVVTSLVGPSLVTFFKEARDRGYQGRFIGTQDNILGFFRAVRKALPVQYLDGALALSFQPYWMDNIPSIEELKEHVTAYHPDSAADRILETGTYTGWFLGLIIADSVRRAADKVGVADLDGTALRDALAETDIALEGWGDPLRITQDYHIYRQQVRMHQFSKDKDDWVAVGDWYSLASLAG